MTSRKFAAFSAAVLAFCILMIGALMLRPPSLLRARATSVGPLVAFAAPMATADLRRPTTDSRPRTPEPRRLDARRPDARRPTRSTFPVTETTIGDIDILPGGATLQTELAELAGVERLDAVTALRGIDQAAERFELYRSAPPQIPGIRLVRRPDSLRPLYVSFAALQALDAYSTWRAVKTSDAREVNPVLTGVADNLPAMLVVKGVATASSVYMVERLWKRNRTAAVLTMVGINAAYGLVVARNFKVAGGLD